MKKVTEMTDKEWEDLEVASAQVLWENLNAEDEADLVNLERPDYGQAGRRYYDPLWSEVVSGLWQGGTDDLDVDRQLKVPMITTKNFDTVITMYADANPVDWFVKEFRYGVWDSDINKMDTTELFDIVRLAHADWKRGKRVLIRCQAGWNRSGLITALVLIREGMGAREAIDLIRKTRSEWALCNKSFEKFLIEQDPKVWQGDSYGNDTPKN
jgi:protein tyrosine phosphatase